MNILYCGDRNTAEGLLLSILSLLQTVREKLNIYILTLRYEQDNRLCEPLTEEFSAYLSELVRKRNGGEVRLFNIEREFCAFPPTANLETRFTPCCMLRLYADLLPLPDRILYLDYDVVCRRDFSEFYKAPLKCVEVAGVLDYYGRWFFRRRLFKLDYLNSGVLLLNLPEIRKTRLFERCRERCRNVRMFLPDQSAINKLACEKLIFPRKYNDQRRLHDDTVLQHFSTTFRLFPYFHTVSVKPWDIERLHGVLGIHEYDGLLEEFQQLRNVCPGLQEVL